MTLRAALYARYSSDQQRAASIEDQFRVCRERAAREGWKIAGAYKDSAISGDSMILRPGIQALLEDARRGLFEFVVAEALDRVSRDQADVATLYKHLRFAGVMIVTPVGRRDQRASCRAQGDDERAVPEGPRGQDPPGPQGSGGTGPLGRRPLLRLRRGEVARRLGGSGTRRANHQRNGGRNRAAGVPGVRRRRQPAGDRPAAERGRPCPARPASSGPTPPSGATRSAAPA